MIGIEQIVPVILVLALLAATLWVLKKRGFANVSLLARGNARASKKQLEIVDRLPLSPQHSLHLVRVADRMLLIGLAPSGCSLLTECTPSGDPPTGSGRLAS